MTTTTLQTTYVDTEQGTLTLKMRDNKRFTIGTTDRDFFSQLRNLPPQYRIELMMLEPEDMLNYIEDSRKELNAEANKLLSDKWYWRETGEEVDRNTNGLIDIDGGFSLNGLLRKTRAKKMSIPDLNKIISWFSDRSEVYRKDDE